jgi:hypothetical protein
MRIQVKGRSFEEIFDTEIESLHQTGLIVTPLLRDNHQNVPWNDPRFDALPNMSVEEGKQRHWKHYRRTFATNYLQRGMYSVQLEHWLEYFPLHESLYVINYEHFQSDPRTVYLELLQFMDLPPFLPNTTTYHNAAQFRPRHPLSQRTREYLAAFL